MGRPKQLAELDGRPLLAHVLGAADEAPVDRVVVALGGPPPVRCWTGSSWAGPSRWWSRAGPPAWATSWPRPWPRPADDWGAVVVLLGDQPLVSGRAVARVVEAWRSGAGPVVTATYGGRPGHPKLFDRRLLPDLLRLTGDTGARDLVAAHPDWVHQVEVGDLGSDADVDVEADLDRVGAMLTSHQRRTP
jgi:CTP:molybdopterin cytidylyltransferase MocA